MPNKQISAFDPPPHTPKTSFYTVCKCLGCSWLLFSAKRIIVSSRERTSVTAENKERQALRHTAPVSIHIALLSPLWVLHLWTLVVSTQLMLKTKQDPPELSSVTCLIQTYWSVHMFLPHDLSGIRGETPCVTPAREEAAQAPVCPLLCRLCSVWLSVLINKPL